jgi:hypothetical protein
MMSEQKDQVRRKRGTGLRASRDSTSLFTLSTPNVYEVESLELDCVDGQKLNFHAVMRNASSQHAESLILTLEPAGTRTLETESIPLLTITLRAQGSDQVQTLSMTTNRAIIDAMRILHPDDDANQTNQRVARRWGTQKFIRFRIPFAQKITALLPEWAPKRMRVGLILVEWPSDVATVLLLSGEKKQHMRFPSSTPSGKRVRAKTKAHLSAEQEELRMRLIEAEKEAAQLRRLVSLLSQGLPVPAELADLFRLSTSLCSAPAAAANAPSLPVPPLPSGSLERSRSEHMRAAAAWEPPPPLCSLPPFVPGAASSHVVPVPSAFHRAGPVLTGTAAAASGTNPAAVYLAAPFWSYPGVFAPPSGTVPFCESGASFAPGQTQILRWMPVPMQVPTPLREPGPGGTVPNHFFVDTL